MTIQVTKSEYERAINTVRNYIRSCITEQAKIEWESDEYLREEYEQDDQNFDDYLKVYFENSMEDEVPGGVNVDDDLFCNFN